MASRQTLHGQHPRGPSTHTGPGTEDGARPPCATSDRWWLWRGTRRAGEMKRGQTQSRPQHARGASLGRPSPPRLRKGKAAQTGKWSASDDHLMGTAPARAGSGRPFPPPTPPVSRPCPSSHLGNSWAQKSLFSGLFWEPALFLETQLGLGPRALWLGVCRPCFSSHFGHFLRLGQVASPSGPVPHL